MSTISQQLIYEYHALIPHPTEPCVLLLPGERGWALPCWESTERYFWQTVDRVNRSLRDQLGVSITTLRCVGITDHVEADRVHVEIVYAMENHSSTWAPPEGGRWIGSDDLDELKLAIPAHRRIITDWFARAAATEVPPERPPWYMPGWFERAVTWMFDQVERYGLAVTGPVEQLRSWERSALLRVETSGGFVFFKAAPAMFAHEPSLTQTLSALDSAHFPAVLAVDLQQRWMLMHDVGSTTLDQVQDIKRWEEALHNFACVQIKLCQHADRLIALGCPQRPLDQLAAHVDALLADTPVMLPGWPGGLDEAGIAALRARLPEFQAMCAELARYRLPKTLEHGDFAAGQVVVRDDDYLFIDWSDSAIAHPFFSMNFFSDMSEFGAYLPDIPNARARLRDAYLQPWTVYEPTDRLIAAFELAQPLSALHNAIIYHRHILPNMENKWEMERMLPFYLKKLL